jgi:hypothetical protein
MSPLTPKFNNFLQNEWASEEEISDNTQNNSWETFQTSFPPNILKFINNFLGAKRKRSKVPAWTKNIEQA